MFTTVVSGGAKTAIDALHQGNANRPKLLRAGLLRHGRKVERTVVKAYMSRRPGLKRVTGHAARGFQSVVVGPPDNPMLVFFNNVRYVKFHADDYVPKAEPRRNKPRLKVGLVWRSLLDDSELIASMTPATRKAAPRA